MRQALIRQTIANNYEALKRKGSDNMTQKLHTIDGVTYREVERKAKVGEKIITVSYEFNESDLKPGDILTVTRVHPAGDGSVSVGDEAFFDTAIGDKYHVLEPVSTCDTCGNVLGKSCCTNETRGWYCSAECADYTSVASPQSPEDIIANLVRRVAQLENQLDDALKNVHTFGEQTEANSDAIRLLDARTQPLVALGSLFAGGDRQ